jgi:cytochrome b6-f complex iron-sulfur subunit
MSDRRSEGEREGPDVDAGSSSRRKFLWKIWLGLGGLALLEYIWLAADFLRPRRSGAADDAESIIVAGPLERFVPGSVTAFPAGKFYLARLENGGFLALSRECTHLGCTVPWIGEEDRFVCPCHSSAYDIRGDVLSPPAPRPLDNYAVRIENGIVKVDISRPLKRRSFEYGQVVLP